MYNQPQQQQTQQQPLYYTPQQQPPIYRQSFLLGLKGRPVSSIDEARAMTIDFDGSVFYFPDLANNRIYTKQINMDGTVSLLMYELKEIPTSSPTNADYITRQEFEAVVAQLKGSPAPIPAPQPAAASKEYNF